MSAILILAFLEGAAVMVIELTAARLMTPYFGQTVFVWTNIIGIILAAVAIGNYFGGWLADRCRTLAPLFVLFVLSGIFCLCIPHITAYTVSLFLGENLLLSEAFPLLIRGSFATALLLFAPPVLLTGACLPFLVKAASAVSTGIGRASGSVYGSSTLGSIVGTFITTYVFIEALGSKRTFYLAGFVMILFGLAGSLVLRFSKKRGVAVLLICLVTSTVAFLAYPSVSFRSMEGVLHEAESRYQYICVRESPHAPGMVHLCLNEDLDSFHSIYSKDHILTGGQYYDYYCLLPCLAGMEHPEKVCILGLAAGTSARQFSHFFQSNPKLAIDGVEIDSATVEAGKDFMDLGSASHCLSLYPDLDGRIFIEHVDRTYDTIIVDAYSKQVYVPFHLSTKEFFQLVFDHLDDGGIMGMNINGFEHTDKVVSVIANTAASVFGSVSVAYLPETHNFMVYAVRGKGHVDPSSVQLPEALVDLEPLLENISEYDLTRKVAFDPAVPCLIDDKAPIELFCDADLIQRSMLMMSQVESME